MTLENLLAVHRLVAFKPSREGIAKLLAAARRNIADANKTVISGENRFDAAYKAIMQCATVALWANGYRTPTSEPGHHMTAIQTLPKTIGLDKEVVIVLDALRKQRNLSDYQGDPISEAAVTECINQAERLLPKVIEWIAQHQPNLLDAG